MNLCRVSPFLYHIYYLQNSEPQFGIEAIDSKRQGGSQYEKELFSYSSQTPTIAQGLSKINR